MESCAGTVGGTTTIRKTPVTRGKARAEANRHSALRKCRNAVSAGVLSPISSAVGRNGAVVDTFPRSGARNYIRRRQILRLRRCAATPHPSRLRRATCLPAGRSVRGSDRPPACHSIPRTPQGEGLRGCATRGEGLGGLYCALILLPALPKMSFQAPSTLAASSWASWASSSAVTSPSGVWPRISSAT